MNLIVRRALALFIDAAIVGMLLSPAAFLISYFSLESSGGVFFTLVGAMMFIFKDFYSSDGSVGKKYSGIKLSFNASLDKGETNYCRLIRNLPLFLWPLEGLIAVVNNGKRLGDILGKSKVTLKSLQMD
ncbi:RDD family protein [Neolewinella agarilytica]|uniref:RDD domain-containing protein n=1 Tax=Neolewinella agarilytica TaxID=478744 RepID=A0A1H9BJR1_9BACT|nr:hypothetical protein [Neolewinella agarilytica]SEP89109.1 hypothetical protein SAMN05444359_103155 [Neolewinella agarilytica]